jgi:hypothetical protein
MDQNYAVGDVIMFKGVPLEMKVQAVRKCEAEKKKDGHSAYRITDPEGGIDWVCGRDVVLIRRGKNGNVEKTKKHEDEQSEGEDFEPDDDLSEEDSETDT